MTITDFNKRVIFQLAPSTPNYSNLGHCIPIWSLFRIPVFQLGSFWGRIFHFGPFSSTYIPMCPPVMELFQYGPHRCRLSVVARAAAGTTPLPAPITKSPLKSVGGVAEGCSQRPLHRLVVAGRGDAAGVGAHRLRRQQQRF